MAGQQFSVPIYVESRYRVDRKKIISCVRNELTKQGMKGACEVSVAIVGRRKMHSLNKKYRKMDRATNVLSFVQSEGQKMPEVQDKLILGDVVVCYPIAVEQAAMENSLVDDKVCELVAHSVRHLMGIHHG